MKRRWRWNQTIKTGDWIKEWIDIQTLRWVVRKIWLKTHRFGQKFLRYLRGMIDQYWVLNLFATEKRIIWNHQTKQ